jgi:hypothetical protein
LADAPTLPALADAAGGTIIGGPGERWRGAASRTERPMIVIASPWRLAALISAALLICASAPALAQKNEGMGVVAPSRPILNAPSQPILKQEMDAAAPPPPIVSAPQTTTASPPSKTKSTKAKKSEPSNPK